MNEMFIFIVPFLLLVIKVEGLPTFVLSVIQYYVCKNNPKYKKVIPIMMGCLSILLFVGFASLMLIGTDFQLLEVSQKVLFMSVGFLFVFLPMLVIMLVTRFTQKRMNRLNEIQRMKINDL